MCLVTYIVYIYVPNSTFTYFVIFKPGVHPVQARFLKIDHVLMVSMHACVCVRAWGY